MIGCRYSQSSLRSHATWFLVPFQPPPETDLKKIKYDEDGERVPEAPVDAATVRAAIGNFKKITFTPSLYGARLSQGFTSSRGSVSIRSGALHKICDITVVDEYGAEKTNHTDGEMI